MEKNLHVIQDVSFSLNLLTANNMIRHGTGYSMARDVGIGCVQLEILYHGFQLGE